MLGKVKSTGKNFRRARRKNLKKNRKKKQLQKKLLTKQEEIPMLLRTHKTALVAKVGRKRASH